MNASYETSTTRFVHCIADSQSCCQGLSARYSSFLLCVLVVDYYLELFRKIHRKRESFLVENLGACRKHIINAVTLAHLPLLNINRCRCSADFSSCVFSFLAVKDSTIALSRVLACHVSSQ